MSCYISSHGARKTCPDAQASLNLISIIVIAAVRSHMRFLQFTIPGSYIDALLVPQKMDAFIELWATPWFDLNSPVGRPSVDEMRLITSLRWFVGSLTRSEGLQATRRMHKIPHISVAIGWIASAGFRDPATDL